MSFDYDLIVLGGGSGGLAAAKEAAKVKPGLKVACFDFVTPTQHGTQWGLGGTCVNVGCIPKKLMHYAAILGHKQADAIEFGWKNISEKKEHDWQQMSQTVLDYIRSLNWVYKQGLTSAKVKYINGLATFIDKNTIQYTLRNGNVERVSAEQFIISVGGRPNLQNFPGREVCVSSDDLFWMKRNPGKTLVVGAGYIALECAGFLNGLGNDVTVMIRGQPLRVFDQMVANQLCELMERKGVRFITPAICTRFEKKNKPAVPPDAKELPDGTFLLPSEQEEVESYLHPSGAIEERNKATGKVSWKIPPGPILVRYKYDGQQQEITEEFDTVLLAIGRKANVDVLNLPAAGVEVYNGKILVDDLEQTTTPNIFALGDCAVGIKEHAIGEKRKVSISPKERPELTPVAIQAGQWLARRLYGKGPAMNYNLIPTTVFTPDEYGCVGLSQEEAERPERDGGIGKENVEVFVSRYGNLEISPTHPHLTTPRSSAFTGRNLWVIRYCQRNGLDWPEATLDPSKNTEVILYSPQETAGVTVQLLNKYQENGEWVYDVQKGEEVLKAVPITHLALNENDEHERDELLVKANGLAKLVVDKRNNRVVGFHFIGENAGEVTQGFALALQLGATKDQFDALVGIHPTAAEEFTVLDTPLSSGKSYLKKAGCGGGSCG